MAEELISSYVDQSAIKAQTDFLIKELERAKKQYQSLSDAIKNIRGSNSFADTSKLAQQAEKEQQALLKTQQQIIKAKQEQVKLENQLLQQQILQEKQAQANLKTTQAQGKVKKEVVTESVTNPRFSDNPADLQKTGSVLNELDKQQAAAANSAFALGQAQQSGVKIVKDKTAANKALIVTEKEIALALAQDKLLAQQAAQALKNKVREELAVKGSLEQRRAALIRLNAVYDNQSPQERASASGQRLQRILGGLDTQVKTLESTTGRSQRNVGNYGSAFDKVKDGAQRAFSGIRTLANILPGLGISGIFLLGYEAIVKVVDILGIAKTKVFDFIAQRETLNTISEKANEAYAAEGVKLRLLSSEYQNANTTAGRRKEIQGELNKLAPAYFSNLDSEAKFMSTIAENTDKASKAMLIRAKITAAEGLLTSKFKDLLDKQFDPTKALTFTDKLKSGTRDIGTTLKNLFNIGAGPTESDVLDLAGRAEKGVKKAEKEYTEFEDFIKKFISGANLELEKLGGKLTGGTTGAAAKAQKALSDRLSQSFERFKLEQENLLRLLKEGAEDERSVYNTRLRYLDVFNAEQKELINRQLEFDLAKNEEKRVKDVAAAKGRADEIEIINFNASEAAKTAKLKAELDIEAADRLHHENRIKLLNDYEQTNRDILDQEYDYEKWTQDQIAEARAGQAAGMKEFEDQDKKDLEDKKKRILSFLDVLQGYYNQVSGIISGALNIGFTKKKNESQLAIEEIEKQRDAELAANEARVQSEQDKAANIAIINSRAEQQKRQQEQRQRDIDRKRAQVDKAIAIFQITLDTAKNVVAAKTIPGKIIAAAFGAAQLAIAVATPIPRFKTGKKRGQVYEGPGIVNDGPNMEVIERADGSIEMPQGRNVLTHVGANDIIHPDKDAWINAVLNAAMRDGSKRLPGNYGKGDNQLAAALTQQTRLLKKIADKPVSTTHATDRGLVQVINWGAKQIKYINENTNW